MSDKNKLQTIENQNEWINWIEEAISKNYFKHYEFKHFNNIQEIGIGGFGKVYRANWKNSEQYFVLKSFNINNTTINEIVHEVITKYIINIHFCLQQYLLLNYLL